MFNWNIKLREITSKEFKEIYELHKKWVESKGKEGKRGDLSYTDLSDCGFRDLELRKINLLGANLTNANFSCANLYGAELINAELRGASFSRANLNSAKLNGSDLTEAHFPEARLHDADFRNGILQHVNFEWAGLRKANLSGIDISYSYFGMATLTEADLSNSNLSNTILREAFLERANLTNTNLASTDFENADLTEANISGANTYHIKNPGWKVEGIICTHYYKCPDKESWHDAEEREKYRYDIKKPEDLRKLLTGKDIGQIQREIVNKRWENDPKKQEKLKAKEWVRKELKKGCSCDHRRLAEYMNVNYPLDAMFLEDKGDFRKIIKEVFYEKFGNEAYKRISNSPGFHKLPPCPIH